MKVSYKTIIFLNNIKKLQINPKKTVTTRSMAALSLVTFYAKDKTGTIRVSLWGDTAERTHLNVSDHVLIENAERSTYQEEATVNTQTFSTVSVSAFDFNYIY